MAFDDRARGAEPPHNIIVEDRSRMSISGVEDVESFDDRTITLLTSKGMLTISGVNLHIERLSLETGELGVEGLVDTVQYSEERMTGGFWSRLFK